MSSGTTLGYATGFFYAHDNRLFLASNRHVMQNADVLVLHLHRNRYDLKKNDTHNVQLNDLNGPRWKAHGIADVALVEIDATLKTQFEITAFSKADFFPDRYVLNPGEELLVMGYPQGYYDALNNLPIFRDATIASAYGVDFNGEPKFLTDANLMEGNSGSPVITKPTQVLIDKSGNVSLIAGEVPHYLVGVHSAGVGKKDDKLGLGVTWYAHVLEEIAEKY